MTSHAISCLAFVVVAFECGCGGKVGTEGDLPMDAGRPDSSIDATTPSVDSGGAGVPLDASPDAGLPDAGEEPDGGQDASEAGDDSGSHSGADSGSDGGSDGGADGGGSPPEAGCLPPDASTTAVDPFWSSWPMPNCSVDVEGGAPNPESYEDQGDGTVKDLVTGLMWQQSASPIGYTWDDANAYCAGLTLAGHCDWRLPTFIELLSLVDYSKTYPAIDSTHFPGTPPDYFWSATPAPGTNTPVTVAYFVNFNPGLTGTYDTTHVDYARCVR
jgi:hypothetical protein